MTVLELIRKLEDFDSYETPVNIVHEGKILKITEIIENQTGISIMCQQAELGRSGVNKVIELLEKEIESYDNAADEFPFNDQAYIGMEIELDKLEKILAYAKQFQAKPEPEPFEELIAETAKLVEADKKCIEQSKQILAQLERIESKLDFDYYTYPAVITGEYKDGFSFFYPDLKLIGFAEYENEEADVLKGWIEIQLREDKPLPPASDPDDVKLKPGQKLLMVMVSIKNQK